MTKKVVGVFGSSHGPLIKEFGCLAEVLGRELGKLNTTVMTGACKGLPHITGREAKKQGSTYIGISPGTDNEEHTNKFNGPKNGFSEVVYTGLGNIGRSPILVRSVDIGIVIAGGKGTLAELGQILADKKPLGILVTSNGVSSNAQQIIANLEPKPSSQVVFDTSPRNLLNELLGVVE